MIDIDAHQTAFTAVASRPQELCIKASLKMTPVGGARERVDPGQAVEMFVQLVERLVRRLDALAMLTCPPEIRARAKHEGGESDSRKREQQEGGDCVRAGSLDIRNGRDDVNGDSVLWPLAMRRSVRVRGAGQPHESFRPALRFKPQRLAVLALVARLTLLGL